VTFQDQLDKDVLFQDPQRKAETKTRLWSYRWIWSNCKNKSLWYCI